MQYSRRVSQILHDEHLATIAMLERLEQALGSHRGAAPPDANDPKFAKLLADLAAETQKEIAHHFRFEEGHLFPKLAEAGEADIGDFLTSEHEAIRAVAGPLLGLVREVQARGFTSASWNDFRAAAGELIERVIFHIQKEEMGLLAALEHFIDPEADAELASAYLAAA